MVGTFGKNSSDFERFEFGRQRQSVRVRECSSGLLPSWYFSRPNSTRQVTYYGSREVAAALFLPLHSRLSSNFSVVARRHGTTSLFFPLDSRRAHHRYGDSSHVAVGATGWRRPTPNAVFTAGRLTHRFQGCHVPR